MKSIRIKIDERKALRAMYQMIGDAVKDFERRSWHGDAHEQGI